MSMLRTQEYFAPLRSRHISLQQWERGLLFESWGEQGARDARGKSRDRQADMGVASDAKAPGEIRGVKRVVPRSVSFSAAFGAEVGPEVRAAKVFRRGLSFPRSFSPSSEIIPEEHSYDHCRSHPGNIRRRSVASANCPSLFESSEPNRLLLSPCFESSSGRFMETSELGISESSNSPSESPSEREADRPLDPEPRLWSKKFFSSGLFFSKERKIFAGGLAFTRSLGRGSDNVRDWRANFKPPSASVLKNGAADATSSNENHEGRLKRNIFTRMFSFSRDPRELSLSHSSSKSFKRAESLGSRKFFGLRRGLSFSPSMNSRGDASSESEFCQIRAACEDSHSRKLLRNWSLSKMLDRRRETLSRARSRSRSFQDSEVEDSQSLFASVRNLSSPGCPDPQGHEERSSDGSESSENSEISLESSNLTSPHLSWSGDFISSSGLLSRSLDPRRPTVRETPPDLKIGGRGRFSELLESAEFRPKKVFGRSFSLPFFTFAESKRNSYPVHVANANRSDKVQQESKAKKFFTRGFSSFNSQNLEASWTNFGMRGSSETFRKTKKFLSRDWTWPSSRIRNNCSSCAQLPISTPNSSAAETRPQTSHRSFRAGTNAFSSLRNSRVLKFFCSKRGAATSQSGTGQHPGNTKVVLLGKVPATGDPEADDLTVFVGERGGSLTKYVLAKRILRHHLFQVLLKCSQDELGSDHDYDSGVPIICDPALFLQVARVVGATVSPEAQFCR